MIEKQDAKEERATEKRKSTRKEKDLSEKWDWEDAVNEGLENLQEEKELLRN